MGVIVVLLGICFMVAGMLLGDALGFGQGGGLGLGFVAALLLAWANSRSVE